MEFHLSSIVDLVYIGEEEIKALASTLESITKGKNMSNLFLATPGGPLSSTFTVSFSDPPRHPSKLLYTVQDTSVSEHSAVQIGLIVAAAFIVTSMILLWAVGGCDRLKPLKNLRSRFYLHSPMRITENGMKTRSTADETDVGTGNVASHVTPGDAEEVVSPHEGGFEVSPQDVCGTDETDNMCNFASIKMASNTAEDENGNVEAHLEEQHDEENLPPCQNVIEVALRGVDNTETLSTVIDMPDSFSLPYGSEELEGLSPRGNMTDISNNFSGWSNGLSIISTTSRSNNTVSTKNPESILADLITCAWQRKSTTDLGASNYTSTVGSSFSSLQDTL